MKLCHLLHHKVVFSHGIHHMASVLSNRKEKIIQSCTVNACSSHTTTLQCLPSLYLNGHHRCSLTEAFNCAASHDNECLDLEASACASDSHGCSSSLEIDDDPFDQTESLLNGVKEVHHCNGDLRRDHGSFSNKGKCEDGVEKVMQVCNGDSHSQHASDPGILKPAKRPFCKRCEKAQGLCICARFKGVVQNKIKITILQNPKEKQHAVGSARVALLGLENVALIDVPEIYSKETFRIRPKVPGSKRSLAGRGGKKILLKGGKWPVTAHDMAPSEADILQMKNLLTEICDVRYDHENAWDTTRFLLRADGNGEMVRGGIPHDDSMWRSPEGVVAKDAITHKVRPPEQAGDLLTGKRPCGHSFNDCNNTVDNGSLCLEELQALIPSGIALLYPSDKAIELSQPLQYSGACDEGEVKPPCQLIVLDGTWSKARRIYFENPWLQSLPHYKLSPASPSLYEGVRKQPKPDCLSTLESIVYALKVLEPDTEGLDGLLEVFDSMVEDQRRCKQTKCRSE